MIKTEYNIELQIDEEKFKITLKEPNAEQREKLKSLSDSNLSLYEKRGELVNALKDKEAEYALNKEIIACSSILEKLPLLLEQKKSSFEISRLKREISNLDKPIKESQESLDTLYEKRFDMLVGGTDKTELKERIKSKGILYTTVFEHFATLVSEAKEKK